MKVGAYGHGVLAVWPRVARIPLRVNIRARIDAELVKLSPRQPGLCAAVMRVLGKSPSVITARAV